MNTRFEGALVALGRWLAMWAAGTFVCFILIVLCAAFASYIFHEQTNSTWEFSGALVGGVIFAGEEQRIKSLEEELQRLRDDGAS